MMSCRTVSLLTHLALCAVLPLTANAAVIADIPLDVSANGVMVEARVNGEGPFSLRLQPSSEHTFLGTELVARLALTTHDDTETPTVQIQTLQLGKLVFRQTTAHVIDSNYLSNGSNARPDGILCWGVLANNLWTLDFPGQKLTIERGQLRTTSSGTTLAMNLEESTGLLDSGRAMTIPIAIGDVKLAARISSSGASGLSLPDEYVEKLPLTDPPGLVARANTPEGTFDIKGTAIAATLQIGPHAIERPGVWFSEMFEGAKLGYDVMRQFAVTFDHKNSLIRLVRAESNNDPRQIRAAMVAEIDGEERLRKAFNADRGKVRLLMILSPT